MCVIWTSAWSSENAIASLIFSTGTRQWVWWRLRVWSKTTTWKVNSEPAIEHRRGRADHSATREWTRVVHGPSISSMQHGLTTIDIKTRSPRLSIAEDALTMAQLSGSTCDSHPRSEHPTHAAWPDIQHDWRWHQTTTAKRWPRGSMDRERRLRKRRRTSSQWTSDQVTTSTTSRTTAWKTTTSTRAMTELEFDYGPSAKNDLELWKKM